jgi:hypothetical protein
VSAAKLSSVVTVPDTTVVGFGPTVPSQPLNSRLLTGLALKPSGVVTDVIVDDVTVAIAGAAPKRAAHAATPAQIPARREEKGTLKGYSS